MNFYKHHIGDYQKKTAALSITEHGAYLLMLQHYYATEKPLPAGKHLHRLLRAHTKAERDAIDKVSAEFWRDAGGGLANDRADEEIHQMEILREHNRAVGRLGGRPKKSTTDETRTVSKEKPGDKPSGLIPGSENITRKKPTPDSRLQTPEKEESKDSSADADVCAPLNGTNGAHRFPACPINEIIGLYHAELPMMPRITVRNAKRDKLIAGRWRQVFVDGKAHEKAEGLQLFREYFNFVRDSKFLTGQSRPRKPDEAPFMADLEFLMSPTYFARTVEGRYHR